MTPRRTKALATLLAQVNRAWPNRSKASDGWIGDTAHSRRKSDHNPDSDGTVDAIDITHDPVNGPDIAALATALIASRDPRIKYIIANRQIISGRKGPSPWKRRKYTGSNPHAKHLHVSVLDEGQDDTAPWDVGDGMAPKDAVLRRGSRGPFVTELQKNLAGLGYPVGRPDGIFGVVTENAVKAFQKARGLEPDGWAGPRTLDAIGRAKADMASLPKIEKAAKTVPPAATDAVEKKAGWWQKATGFFGASGIGGGLLYGLDWRMLAVAAAAVIVIMLLLVIFRRQLVGAFREINAEVGG